MPTRIHDEIIEEFVPTCRHCKKTAEHHVGGHMFPRQADPRELMFPRPWPCLFDSTAWDPMSSSEWVTWRKSLWAELGGIGTEYIRDQLKQAGFASKMKQDLMVYGTATIDVDSSGDAVNVKLVDPTTVTLEDKKKP
jgi:hypothetical protein